MKRILTVLIGLNLSVFSLGQNVEFCDSNNLMSIVSPSGKTSPCMYTEVSDFINGFAWVNKGEYYAYLDTNLNPITDFVFAQVYAFSEGFAMVGTDTTLGFINNTGQLICEMVYLEARDFNRGFAAVKQDSLWGLINGKGDIQLKAQYSIPPILIKPDFVLVVKNNKWGVLDERFKELYPTKYDFISDQGEAFIDAGKELLGRR